MFIGKHTYIYNSLQFPVEMNTRGSKNKQTNILKLKFHGCFSKCDFISCMLFLNTTGWVRVGFSVLFSNAIENEPFSTTHWTLISELPQYTTTNMIKCCQIHFHLFQIKLNTLLVPLIWHFTLKESWKVHKAM